MAKAKTGRFYLTETVTLPAASASGTRVQATIDIGSLTNVPTGQVLAVHAVDYIFQVGDGFSQEFEGMVQSNGCLTAQLTDLNPGTAFIRADDQSLISSGALNIDFTNNIGTTAADFYPDNMGPSKNSSDYLVVNDNLFCVVGNNGAIIDAANAVHISFRILVSVVKLSTSDWSAIALRSVSSD
jgi:hypothetical protein